MLKKFVVIFINLLLILCISACGNNTSEIHDNETVMEVEDNNEEKIIIEYDVPSLSYEDFTIGDSNHIDTHPNWTWWYNLYCDADSKPTQRNIDLNSTFDDVVNAYGSTIKKYFDKNDEAMSFLRYNQNNKESSLYNIVEGDYYVNYDYIASDNKYNLRFYFDNNSKLKMILFWYISPKLEYSFKHNLLHINDVDTVADYDENMTIDDMDFVTFGWMLQDDIQAKSKDPIEWIILDKQDGKALLLSKKILYTSWYNPGPGDDNFEWKNSYIRKWLNDTFYNTAFNNEEKNSIIKTNNTNNQETDENNLSDDVFLLSVEEVEKYFNQNENDVENKRLATYATNNAKSIINFGQSLSVFNNDDWSNGNSSFWLRSYFNTTYCAACVYGNGKIDINMPLDALSIGVRPAIWVSYSE